tara:strand:+ start:134 stop:1000 length:867 start_codon:yes stop_codon:yes gene_type:complete
MHRIIDGTLYARHDIPYAHEIKVHDLGHGHTEAVILPKYGWHEVCALSSIALEHYREACQSPPELSEAEKLAKLVENRERATRRARTKVRRLAKAKGLTTLLTLTYRENMLDRDRMQRDLDVFLKRVRRVIPGFQYIAVFERQKRGAWHAHLAVEKVLSHYVARGRLVRSYDLLRSMWRAVVGTDNGNVDVSRNKALSRSSAKLAAYVSKYIGKTFDQADKYVNSYSASGRALPRAMAFTVQGTLSMALDQWAALMAPEIARGELFCNLIDGGGMFVCLSPPEVRWTH